METKISNDFQVKEGRTIITVPHLEDKVNFVHPAFKGNYKSVGEQIESSGLIKPTPEETASLVDSAYKNLDNDYAKEIKSKMKDNRFWMFNEIKYVPNEGAFIQKPNQEEVFVPFGYKVGEQSPLELSKNPFAVGLFGEEGADKIARVADTYSKNLYLWSFENVESEIKRVSALVGDWNFGNRLDVSGNDWYDDGDGHSFGVSPSEKSE